MVYCIMHTRIMSTAGGGEKYNIKSNQDLFKSDIMYGFHHK